MNRMTMMKDLSNLRVVMAAVMSGSADLQTRSLLSVLLTSIDDDYDHHYHDDDGHVVMLTNSDLSLARARTKMLHSAC